MTTDSSTGSPFTGYVDDPHGVLAAMRAEAPVHRITMPNGYPAWLVTGYDEARAATADERLVTSLAVSPSTDLPPDIAISPVWRALAR